jgi:cytochrome c-type biogenesis protein CcmE
VSVTTDPAVTTGPDPVPVRPPSRRRAWVLVLVIAAALIFLLVKGLAGATTYFYTTDQAVHLRAQLGTTRFRIEGTVVSHTVVRHGDQVDFTISNHGVSVPVVNTGYPPQLFQPGIPVVLEGQFRGDTFDSDLIMVKHSADYVAAHPGRVRDFVGKHGT